MQRRFLVFLSVLALLVAVSIMTAPEVLLGERRFRHEWWQSDKGTLWVCFDENDRVVEKNFTPGRSTSTFWTKVRGWLGL